MSGDTSITVAGNLTADPELRFTTAGTAVVNFTIASTPRAFDNEHNEWVDGETQFLPAHIWRGAAENAAGSLAKGMRVIATGELKSRSYETRTGEKRTVLELEVEEIGPSLRYAAVPRGFAKSEGSTTANSRVEAPGGDARHLGAGKDQRGGAVPFPQDDPWFTSEGHART